MMDGIEWPDPEDLDEIDAPVRELVVAMNEIPGLWTLTSCGGHPVEEQKYFDQVDEGHFYVTFQLQRNYKGWRALACLVNVLGNDGRILSIDVSGDEEEIYFSIGGNGAIKPDEVADRIRAVTNREGRDRYPRVRRSEVCNCCWPPPAAR